jgi:hypothetical protein
MGQPFQQKGSLLVRIERQKVCRVSGPRHLTTSVRVGAAQPPGRSRVQRSRTPCCPVERASQGRQQRPCVAEACLGEIAFVLDRRTARDYSGVVGPAAGPLTQRGSRNPKLGCPAIHRAAPDEATISGRRPGVRAQRYLPPRPAVSANLGPVFCAAAAGGEPTVTVAVPPEWTRSSETRPFGRWMNLQNRPGHRAS